MMQEIKLNKLSVCTTDTTKEIGTAVVKIKNSIETYKIKSPELDRTKKQEALESIFKDIKAYDLGINKDKSFINRSLAYVGCEFAKTYYGDKFSQAKQLLFAVLEFLVATIDFKFDSNLFTDQSKLISFSSLSDWEKSVENLYPKQSAFEKILYSTAPEAIYKRLDPVCFLELQFLLGHTLRMIGQSMMNIDFYDVNPNDHKNLFTFIYQTAEGVLKPIENHCEEYYKDLTELEYNMSYYLTLIDNPNDIEGACKALGRVALRDSSPSKKAQILNMQIVLHKGKDGFTTKTLDLMKQVVDLREEVSKAKPSYEFDFLLANARNGLGTIARSLGQFELAEKYLQLAYDFAKDPNKTGNNPSYSAIYCLNFMKLKIAQKQPDEALRYCHEAIEYFKQDIECIKNIEDTLIMMYQDDFFSNALKNIKYSKIFGNIAYAIAVIKMVQTKNEEAIKFLEISAKFFKDPLKFSKDIEGLKEIETLRKF